jgi:NAD(P)-dependent dehydrogenase (short-subunit alcohol dehydrogenase family)
VNRLQGQVAIITGAGSGIGRGIARAFATEGASLALVGRTLKNLEAVAAELAPLGAGRSLCVRADVTREDEVDALFARVLKELGGVDILVNNAGAFDGGPLDELSAEAWDRVINTNLRGPFLCTRAALRIMKPRGRGRIINIGSIAAQRVRPHSAPYAASKHGLWGLTQVTALEGREYGVTCGALHPGNVSVERRQTSGKAEDDEPMMSPDELAQAALLMATLPPHVEMLEAIVLPSRQMYVGRG